MSAHLTRRAFLQLGSLTAGAQALGSPMSPRAALDREVGITTGSFMRHLSSEAQPGKLRLIDLPTLMRNELGMKVIDLMTATLPSMAPDYLDQLRRSAEAQGCILTNLKMNQPGLDMASPDKVIRAKAIAEYKRTIDAAEQLGVRWVRPIPGRRRPNLNLLAAGYRELIDYAGPKGIELLIENFGWIQTDPDAIPRMIASVGRSLHAQPDTGNWNDNVRDEGLAKAFPHAVSCDFKAFEFDAHGRHPHYDLRKCFQIGWAAGFRGPWCIEHFAPELKRLFREMGSIRDDLARWMSGA